MIITKSTAEQLTDIYLNDEHWHAFKMPYEQALVYHQHCLDNGTMTVYEENGEVLGYYERYFIFDTCFLHNIFIKEDYRKGHVFKELYKSFFSTMPKEVTKVVGVSQKLNRRLIERKIKRSRHG